MTRERLSMPPKALPKIILLWLCWSIILSGYMYIAGLRVMPATPDNALLWTDTLTQFVAPRTETAFLDTHVAWDSYFYLSVATAGFEDKNADRLMHNGSEYSVNYAVFPLYPALMHILKSPFLIAGVSPYRAAIIAGVIISFLGTLAAAIALYDLVYYPADDDDTAFNTVMLLLIFPSSVFLVTVYTEALFIGLSFGCLALAQRQKYLPAAILAALATWTRSIGGILLLPLLLSWGMQYRRAGQGGQSRKHLIRQLPLLALPPVAYLLWRMAFGTAFDAVAASWFHNTLFNLEVTRLSWEILLTRAATEPQTLVLISMNLGALVLALLSLLVCARRYPHLALYGAIVLLVTMTAGWVGVQGTSRYVLVLPTLWLMLGNLSRNVLFEKIWTLLSVLLLALNAYLFSVGFWVG